MLLQRNGRIISGKNTHVFSERYVSRVEILYHKSHAEYPATEPGAPCWETCYYSHNPRHAGVTVSFSHRHKLVESLRRKQPAEPEVLEEQR